jgi:tetratricopeptide (TPR) repeat protein
MKYGNNLIALALIILIMLSAKNTYEKIGRKIPITGASDIDTATVRLFVKSNEVVEEPNPIMPSGGGGGGVVGPPNRPVNLSKKVILELDAPPSQTLFAGDEISVLIVLRNKGDFDLTDIVLNKATNAPDLALSFSKSYFDTLSINGEDGTILKIKSLVDPTAHIGINNYVVTIDADVGNFDYRASLKFYINLKERNYEKRLESLKELQFAEGLINQTPECSDFIREINKAWALYEKSEYDDALSMMDTALEKCRNRVSPPEEGKEGMPVLPKTGMGYLLGKVGITASPLFLIIIILLLLILLAGLYYYLKKKKVPKPVEGPLKTRLEIAFDDTIYKTKVLIRERKTELARRSYMRLRSLYEAITQSALPVSKKSNYYVEVMNVHNELSRILKK